MAPSQALLHQGWREAVAHSPVWTGEALLELKADGGG